MEHAPTPAEDHVAKSSDQFKTVDDVARKFNVPKSWIYVAVASGKLPHVRIGKYVRFRPDDIESYLRSQQRGTDSR